MSSSLDVREQLYAVQQTMLRSVAPVVLQIGLNMPGGHTLYPWLELFNAALVEVQQTLSSLPNTVILEKCDLYTAVGPYCLLAVRADAFVLKEHMVSLEESALWGRLWDLDILTAERPIDRSALGLPARRCLICGESGHVCRRLRSHNLAEIIEAAHRVVGGTQGGSQ